MSKRHRGAPEAIACPIASLGPARLVKKADLPLATQPAAEPAPRSLGPERTAGNDRPLVERRPFRHVEVRRLGPGRGHNRTLRGDGYAVQPR